MSTQRLFENRVRALATRRATASLHFVGTGSRRLPPWPIDTSIPVNPHVAGRHELAYVVSGEALIRTPDQVFQMKVGDLLLVEPGVDHHETPATPPVPYVLCWFSLEQSYAIVMHTSYTPNSEVILGGPSLQLHGRTDVQSIAMAVGAELTNQSHGWQLAARALLHYLSCILVRRIRAGQDSRLGSSESPTIAHDPAAWEVVQDALAHCRASFHRRLRVEDVARAVGYSSSRLSHLFSAYLGQSVADHVRSLRMARARDLLESTDLTVSEVARRVGYGDPAHFSRAFKRSERVSPNAYRERLRGA